MKYVYLANGRVGLEILRWLVERDEGPEGLVIHPSDRQQLSHEISQISGLSQDHIIDALALRTSQGISWLEAHQPVWLVSVFFGYILNPEILKFPRIGAINLHPGFLPFNKGAYPNVWSIYEGTPAGATLHFMETGVDTGDIISQKEVPVRMTDTGASLYQRLEEASIELFKETWPDLAMGAVTRKPQPEGGSSHRLRDVEAIDKIDMDQTIRAGDLINILRARTFPPHKGAYLDFPDRRIYLRLELIEEVKQKQ